MGALITKIQAGLFRQLRPRRARPGLSFANTVIVALILIGFLLMALETEHSLSAVQRALIGQLQIFIVLSFAIEFCLRVWAVGADQHYEGRFGRLKLFREPMIWVDFLAFAPELLVMVFWPEWAVGVAYARGLRFLRLLKLCSYVQAFEIIGLTLRASAMQLGATLVLALVTIYISAYALYFAEGQVQPESFGSVPRALWWSVETLTTVGYGDAVPITPLGKILGAFIALIGVALVALPAGILATTFQAQMQKKKR